MIGDIWKTLLLTALVGFILLVGLSIVAFTKLNVDPVMLLLVLGLAIAIVLGVASGNAVVVRRRSRDGAETAAEIRPTEGKPVKRQPKRVRRPAPPALTHERDQKAPDKKVEEIKKKSAA